MVEFLKMLSELSSKKNTVKTQKEIMTLLIKEQKKLFGKTVKYNEQCPSRHLTGLFAGFVRKKICGSKTLSIMWIKNGDNRITQISKFNIEFLQIDVSLPEISFNVCGAYSFCGTTTILLD